jgi:hypothetical protein
MMNKLRLPMHKTKKIVLFQIFILLIFISPLVNVALAGELFHPKEVLIEKFKTLCDNHPSQASYEIIGQSYEHRDIYIFRFGNPNGGAVLWDGSMHGWEDMGSEVEYQLALWLLTSNTAEADRILERNFVLFVPIVNMDSTERENRDFEDDIYGVDLNRNFVTGFRYIPPSNRGYPYSYRGDYGGSEPETQAIRNALQTYQPKIYVNTHYGGGPYLRSSGINTTLSDWIKNRTIEISSEIGFTFPWDIVTGRTGGGGGLATAEGNSFGANSWIWEIASATTPIGEGGDTSPYTHTSHSLLDIENYFAPKMLPALRAMCESCEVTSPSPSPSSFPAPSPSPSSFPAPSPSPSSFPAPSPSPSSFPAPSPSPSPSPKPAAKSEDFFPKVIPLASVIRLGIPLTQETSVIFQKNSTFIASLLIIVTFGIIVISVSQKSNWEFQTKEID